MSNELTASQMHQLLVHAARAVRAALSGQIIPGDLPPGEVFRQPAAVFVTLRRNAELCGCIGVVRATRELWDATAHAARAAALDDPRFEILPREAIEELDVEISVLSEMQPIKPESVRCGEHGLLLRWRDQSGLLLPQVAREHDLDRDGFLSALCRKAGVPESIWMDPETQLEAFTVQCAHGPARELLQDQTAG